MRHATTSRRHFLQVLVIVTIAIGVLHSTQLFAAGLADQQRHSPAEKPNFIIIFTDDQGYSDVGCFGSDTIETPQLDRMADQGMRFTSFYSQTVCGPARCALLTSCYPRRVKEFDSHKIGRWRVSGDEITLAEILKKAGYTTGCIGKWDISGRAYREGMVPNDQGFDYYFGTLGANDGGRVKLWRNRKELGVNDDMGSLTGLYTDEAIKFLKENKEGPFFLYLAHTMPHVIIGASEKFRGRSRGGLFGDVIEEIDWNVGRILDTVRQLGLHKNTYVLYTSDNGPWLCKGKHGGSAKPLRNGKGSSWEGGFRVPCIVWGPGRVPAKQTSNALMCTMDIMPTFAALAGAEMPTDRVIDGRDQSKLITGKTDKSARDNFFYYVQGNLHAVRQGKWKLALPNRKLFYGYARDKSPVTKPELYDLENDISEKNDVSDKHPEIVQQLLKLAEQAREDIGDLDRKGKNAR